MEEGGKRGERGEGRGGGEERGKGEERGRMRVGGESYMRGGDREGRGENCLHARVRQSHIIDTKLLLNTPDTPLFRKLSHTFYLHGPSQKRLTSFNSVSITI